MRIIFFLSLYLGSFCLLTKLSIQSFQMDKASHMFEEGDLDAYKTLEALGLYNEDYSIVITNSA